MGYEERRSRKSIRRKRESDIKKRHKKTERNMGFNSSDRITTKKKEKLKIKKTEENRSKKEIREN